MFRYRLRTLLLLTILGPPVLMGTATVDALRRRSLSLHQEQNPHNNREHRQYIATVSETEFQKRGCQNAEHDEPDG